jgi:hypothetical protein
VFLQIENFLTAAEVQTLSELARQAQFVDGRRSNPHNLTKDNAIAKSWNEVWTARRCSLSGAG